MAQKEDTVEVPVKNEEEEEEILWKEIKFCMESNEFIEDSKVISFF